MSILNKNLESRRSDCVADPLMQSRVCRMVEVAQSGRLRESRAERSRTKRLITEKGEDEKIEQRKRWTTKLQQNNQCGGSS